MSPLKDKHILLVITGGIAAYKSLELIRLLRRHDVTVTAVMTEGAKQFVTPLSVAALTGRKAYDQIFDMTTETEMGHIQLSRLADFILIAPATANFIAKMTHGMADDLASTLCLASDKPILIAPAMNVRMWEHPATQDNIALLQQRGVHILSPAEGAMACGEWGEGRLPEPQDIFNGLEDFLGGATYKNLRGKTALVTAGPTVEPIDPVRYVSNHSSGKQGYAIAKALAMAGVQTTLISGPTNIMPPSGVKLVRVQTADEMLKACMDSLPVDIAICSAAVADWKAKNTAAQKIKKDKDKTAPVIEWEQNPDILHTLSNAGNRRPQIVVGFAAETENLIENATSKLNSKNCDLIVANDVSEDKVFGQDINKITMIDKNKNIAHHPEMGKDKVADILLKSLDSTLN